MAYNPAREVCVYVVAEEGTPDVAKIGVTELLARRIGGMQSSNWRKLTIFAAFRVPSWEEAQQIEGCLLEKLLVFKIRGEWVRLSPSELAAHIVDHLEEVAYPVINLISPVENVIKIGERNGR